jgi:hypothetical protein
MASGVSISGDDSVTARPGTYWLSLMLDGEHDADDMFVDAGLYSNDLDAAGSEYDARREMDDTAGSPSCPAPPPCSSALSADGVTKILDRLNRTFFFSAEPPPPLPPPPLPGDDDEDEGAAGAEAEEAGTAVAPSNGHRAEPSMTRTK